LGTIEDEADGICPELVLRFADRQRGRFSSKHIVSSLLGSSSPEESYRRSVLDFLDDYLESKMYTDLDEKTWLLSRLDDPGCKNFLALLYSYRDILVFVTDTGIFGVIPQSLFLAEGLVVAGLFGINVPFVLEPSFDETWKMISLAHLANHTLGDEYLATRTSDTDWKEAVGNGPL
jgi:hypothetical protein